MGASSDPTLNPKHTDDVAKKIGKSPFMELGNAGKLVKGQRKLLRFRAIFLVANGDDAQGGGAGCPRGSSRDGQPFRRGISGATVRPLSRNPKRGRRDGRSAYANRVSKRARVQRWIRDTMPDPHPPPPLPRSFRFALWTCASGTGADHKKLRKTHGLSTMRLYYEKVGFRFANGRDAGRHSAIRKQIAAWLKPDYPSIAARRKARHGGDYRSDERVFGTRIRSAKVPSQNLGEVVPDAVPLTAVLDEHVRLREAVAALCGSSIYRGALNCPYRH